MPNNVSDILITPATIWYGPVDEPLPDETTVALGAAWGGNWKNLGYTLEPVSVGYNQETFDLEVEQITNPVARRINKEEVTLETVLAEFSKETVELAFNATGTVTAAGVGQKGFTEWKMGGKVNVGVHAFGLEGTYQNDQNQTFPVRVFIYRANCVLNGQLQFAKSKGVGIPVQIKALADTAKAAGEQIMLIQKVTAPATS